MYELALQKFNDFVFVPILERRARILKLCLQGACENNLARGECPRLFLSSAVLASLLRGREIVNRADEPVVVALMLGAKEDFNSEWVTAQGKPAMRVSCVMFVEQNGFTSRTRRSRCSRCGKSPTPPTVGRVC